MSGSHSNPGAPARALIDDALQRLGTARLSLDLAKDLLDEGGAQIASAGERIATAAGELRAMLAGGVQ
jgi:hypothetical protein